MSNVLESQLERHDLEITYIKESLKDLVDYSKETAKQLQKISEAIIKQEVIIEKVTNIEAIHRESVARLHDRVDNVENILNSEKDGVTHRIDKVEEECNKVKDIAKTPKHCTSHEVINTELTYIKKQLAMHTKIFWTVTSGIVMSVLYAILQAHLK